MQPADLPKILLVDDMHVNMSLLDEILSALDVITVHANSGEEALIQVHEHEFALIISDVYMPGMSGYEMLQQIRHIKGCENISTIFLSATYREESDVVKGIKSGAIDFITKPFNSRILLGKVEIFLKLYEQKKKLDGLIDELNAKNKELIQNRVFVEKITDAVIDAIIMTDDTGKIVFWNRGAAKIFGYSSEEAMQSDIHTLLILQANTGRNENRFIISKDKNNEKFVGETVELTAHNKKNVTIPIELTIAPLIIDNKWYAVAIARDISERKESERKLLEANNAKSEFIANMSHEFRTPMNVVIGISKALINYDSSNLNEEQIEGLRHIFQSGTRLLDLVNDLLDLAKIESRKMVATLKPFPVEKLLSDLKGLAEELTKEKNLTFSVRKSQNMPEYLISDQRKLYQILVNLISNAVKFTEKGKIQLHVYKLKALLHFELRDTGIGIEKENIEKVFEKFSQIDNSAQKKYKGTGLGLALCKELVTLLNGQISIESALGKGTVVRFFVPFQPADTMQINTAELPESASNIDSSKKKLILLIEDDKELLYYYENYLSKYNNLVECAEDGNTGLEKIKSLHPDIVILDLKLKHLSGYEILRILKFEPEICNIPVIIISDLDDLPNDALYNYDLFLNKPIDERILLSHIDRISVIKKNKSAKALIISENIKELRFLKQVFNDLNILASTLPNTKKTNSIIDKFAPNIIIVDLDNVSIDIPEFVQSNFNLQPDAKPSIIFYTEEIKNPELISLIHHREEIAVVLKSPTSRNSLSRIVSRSTGMLETTYVKTPRILIVDDDKESIQIIKLLLNGKFELIVAYDGQEAIEKFMLEKPDMVLMDIRMPEVDGFTAFSEIRKQSKRVNVPIIAITAWAMEQDRNTILKHGFNDFIAKPINHKILVKTLGKYIDFN
jgi:PAS domain S-box-containing protein